MCYTDERKMHNMEVVAVPSRISKAVRTAMHMAKPVLGALDYTATRKAQDSLSLIVHPEKDTSFERFDIGCMPAAWIRPKNNASGRHAILHFHGGSYIAGSLAYARIIASKLSAAAQLDVLTCQYRLAPESPFPAAVDDALAAYVYLLEQGYPAGNIALAGESAGGGLVLALTQRLRELAKPQPGALVCMSAWTNLSCSFESCLTNMDSDPTLHAEALILAGRMYAGLEPVEHPLISPAFGSFAGFPPTLLQAGSLEILVDDSRQCYRKMCAEGAEAYLEVYPDMWHVFQLLSIPESVQAFTSIREFLRAHLHY